MTRWRPQGRSVVAPFIIVEDADAVIDFARAVFGAELLRPVLRHGDGRVWNAELDIGGSTIMVGSGGPDMVFTAFVHVYVNDVEAVFAKAQSAGAEVVMPVSDQFYGDRAGGVRDAAGNTWWIATHKKDLTDEELEAAKTAEERRRSSA